MDGTKTKDRDDEKTREKSRKREREHREKGKEKEKETGRERDFDKQKDKGRENGKVKDKDRERDEGSIKKEKEKRKDREREKEREKDKEKERERDKDRDKMKDKDRNKDRDKDRVRDRKEKDRHKEKEKEIAKDRERGRDREKEKEKEKEKERKSEKSRDKDYDYEKREKSKIKRERAESEDEEDEKTKKKNRKEVEKEKKEKEKEEKQVEEKENVSETKVKSKEDEEKEEEQRKLDEDMEKRRKRVQEWQELRRKKEEEEKEEKLKKGEIKEESVAMKNGKSWTLDGDESDEEEEEDEGERKEINGVMDANSENEEEMKIRDGEEGKEIGNETKKEEEGKESNKEKEKEKEEEIDPLDAFMNMIEKENKPIIQIQTESNGVKHTDESMDAEAIKDTKMEERKEEEDEEEGKETKNRNKTFEKRKDKKKETKTKIQFAFNKKGVIMGDDTDEDEGAAMDDDSDAEGKETTKKKDEEEDDMDFLKRVSTQTKADKLPPVDHSKINYPPFRKCFYKEVKEVSRMSMEEVKAYHSEHEFKIRGKDWTKPIKTWNHSGLSNRILEAIKKLGFEKPMPIQAQAMPIIMSGRDCIGIAKTGSGKTLAFVLPMLRHILDQPPLEAGDGPIALIMAPTRELVQQIYNDIRRFTRVVHLTVVPIYGGSGVAQQISELKRGTHIVVCTPGRMIDILCTSSGKITNLRRVTYLVMDEADRMFDMGFEPQIARVVQNTRPDRQTVLFSATFPRQVEVLARKVLTKPVELQVGGRSVVNKDITQKVEVRSEADRFLRLLELLGEWSEKGKTLVFVHSQDKCDSLFKDLLKAGYPCLSLHGAKDQTDRESTLSDFKSDVCNLLVATSVAARGLDVKELELVVNYDVPNHYEDYVHRVGRTGRAGRKGHAVTFISKEEDRFAPDLLRALELAEQEIPEDLRTLAVGFLTKVKEGKETAHGSGYGGSGFKFNEEEEEQRKAVKKALAKEYGYEDEEEGKSDEGEDEEGEGIRKVEGAMSNQSQTPNQIQAQVQAAAMAAVAKAGLGGNPVTAGSTTVQPLPNPTQQLQALIQQRMAMAGMGMENLMGGFNTAGILGPGGLPGVSLPGMAGNIPGLGIPGLGSGISQTPGLSGLLGPAGMVYSTGIPGFTGFPDLSGMGAVGLTGAGTGIPGLPVAQPGFAGLGDGALEASASNAASRAAAFAAAISMQHTLKTQKEETIEHYEAEFEINDFPQHARWKVTHKDALNNINEWTGAAITTRGMYFPPGKTPGPGDKKLYLFIEGPTEASVKKAKVEIKKILEETSLSSAGQGAIQPGKYSVL